uniref:NR LBD domain-containing protein n=1 Tax=Angiostrongylus cantonensis TaxID=6313 RepID=A0A0K0DQT0_ANGCA
MNLVEVGIDIDFSHFFHFSFILSIILLLLLDSQANEPLKAPLDLCISNELTLMDVVKISEAALKRIVCMAKDLSAFQTLEIEDKKNIMKGIELLILRGVMAFDPSKNTWNHFFKNSVKTLAKLIRQAMCLHRMTFCCLVLLKYLQLTEARELLPKIFQHSDVEKCDEMSIEDEQNT